MTRYLLALLILAVLAHTASAQVHRRDPLNSKESDQLRETAMEPDKKLPLYANFARARLETINHLRSDERFAEGRGPKIQELLQDFKTIVDELDRNIDSYANQKLDFRKGLRVVVQADTEFQLQLRALKETSSDPKNAAEGRDYEFALLDAVDAVDGDLENARDLLTTQEKEAAEAKAKAKQKK